ncbi:MAG: FAD-dependent oxidoreductase [Ilumatobacteraceae bacterium]
MASVDVLVVGGGPCGLAAALGAARRGRSVRLLEGSPHLGGMAASFEVAGQRVDHGSHRLHPSATPPVRALLDELLGPDLQERRRNGRLHLPRRRVSRASPRASERGVWVDFPLRAPDLVRSVPIGTGARIAADLVTGPLRHAGDDSYAEFVRAGLGPTALATFHGPMAAKLWGRDPAQLSAELARRRIAVNGGGRLLRRIARGSRPSGRTFLYPRLGYGEVVDRLADAAATAGVEISLSTAVAELTAGAPPRATLTDGGRVEAGRVLWTAPLEALAAVVPDPRSAPPPEHRGLVLTYLALDEDRYSEVDAHYVPDAAVAFARLSEPKNYRTGPDPAGRTVLCAEIPATAGDTTWSMGDADLGDLVLDGMRRIGLRLPTVAAVAVRRQARVYPVLTVGADARRAVLAWSDTLDGVTVLGRQGLHVADNLHHVLDMALAAAGCLGGGGDGDGWDTARWATERQRFEAFVVDD